MTSLPVLATTLLADGENKKSGPLGLVVILVLCVACYFLFKSMSKHLRKVREEFPTDAPPQGGELAAPAPSTAPAADGDEPDRAAQPAESPPAAPAPPGDSA